MPTLADILRSDANTVFLADFGEDITYTTPTDAPITVKAIITTAPLAKDGATPRNAAKEFHVQVSRTDVPTRPVLSGSKVTITGQPEKYVVAIVDESDPGMWHLLVR